MKTHLLPGTCALLLLSGCHTDSDDKATWDKVLRTDPIEVAHTGLEVVRTNPKIWETSTYKDLASLALIKIKKTRLRWVGDVVYADKMKISKSCQFLL